VALADGPVGMDLGDGGFLTGIDPGRGKFGFAFVAGSGRLLASGIGRTTDAPGFFRRFREGDYSWLRPMILEGTTDCLRNPRYPVICGEGTHRVFFLEAARVGGIPVTCAPEAGTTLRARKLYWSLHPPGGLWRMVPLSLRVPPRDIDDLAAWAIVMKWMLQVAGTPEEMEDTENGS
jgi:hypothetical protein